MNPEYCIAICNHLLRGELSAVEIYDFALAQNDTSPARNELVGIRQDHAQAAASLRENILSMGGRLTEGSGASAAQDTADIFGEDSALVSLEIGEKSEQQDYENALIDEDVPPGCKNLIRFQLLPGIGKHIAILEQLRRTA